jgi:hypothetical protein
MPVFLAPTSQSQTDHSWLTTHTVPPKLRAYRHAVPTHVGSFDTSLQSTTALATTPSLPLLVEPRRQATTRSVEPDDFPQLTNSHDMPRLPTHCRPRPGLTTCRFSPRRVLTGLAALTHHSTSPRPSRQSTSPHAIARDKPALCERRLFALTNRNRPPPVSPCLPDIPNLFFSNRHTCPPQT